MLFFNVIVSQIGHGHTVLKITTNLSEMEKIASHPLF